MHKHYTYSFMYVTFRNNKKFQAYSIRTEEIYSNLNSIGQVEMWQSDPLFDKQSMVLTVNFMRIGQTLDIRSVMIVILWNMNKFYKTILDSYHVPEVGSGVITFQLQSLIHPLIHSVPIFWVSTLFQVLCWLLQAQKSIRQSHFLVELEPQWGTIR